MGSIALVQATPEQHELWRRIASLDLDQDEATLPFSARLARDNGWSRAFAARAVEEYRRFVFLAMVAGQPVTPSDEVDQVWHLHLCYTRSYWDELCGEVLGRPLHHGPTRGGAAERARFDDQYRRTLASYERVFGAPPPARWWPSPAARFAPRRWQRMDLAEVVAAPRRVLGFAAAAALLWAAPACSEQDDLTPCGAILSVVLVPAAVIVWASRHEHRGRRPRRRDADRDGGCGAVHDDGEDGGDGCGGCGE